MSTIDTIDRIRAIHREATSSPWDGRWSIEADTNDEGYTSEWWIEAETTGWVAAFAYVQHLDMFVQAKRHMEALCDIAALAQAFTDATAEGDIDLAQRLEGSMIAALNRLNGEGGT